MNLANYEWYGWVVLFLAISTSIGTLTNLVAVHGGRAVDGKVTVEIQTGLTALLIVLAMWLATP